ncbi:MAG: hypothetical protein H6R04_16 [Burkholderiaceae bacterium]|nr:hypothetical protein [Burkholderiaceae bacterium]
MSGPCTALVGADPISILISAAAIRAAEAIASAQANAEALSERHAAEREAQQAGMQAASAAGQQVMQQQVAQAEERFAGLLQSAARFGLTDRMTATRPVRPAGNDAATLVAYAHGLQQLTAELELLLKTEAARRMGALGDDAQQIEIPAEFAAAAPAQTPSQPLPPSVSQRLLARIAHLGEIPANIQSVAQELEATPPDERAGLLATELRARIAAYLDAVQQRQVQEATALVLEQTLKDLGYQVEELGSTLFVEGGVAHFRRAGWGEYMVRMRAAPSAATLNFNVIRAVSDGKREFSVRDHLAEDRWCAEFPALKRALAARGLNLNVTRQLSAGEVPVQLVDAGQLPSFADEEAAATDAQQQPMQRELR